MGSCNERIDEKEKKKKRGPKKARIFLKIWHGGKLCYF